jgi:hypothetical protein
MTTPYSPPSFKAQGFSCPHCGAFAKQRWDVWSIGPSKRPQKDFAHGTTCDHCSEHTLWYDAHMVYPAGLVGPIPSDDMSDDVREVYEEARAIAATSPRAAAALLGVSIEMVVNELVPGKGKLYDKIRMLVEQGLDRHIQKMLDSVRWYGNDGGAHPGEIDLKEQPEVVAKLLFCVNRIVEQMVTWPREIEKLYNTVPESKRKVIEERDRNAPKAS